MSHDPLNKQQTKKISKVDRPQLWQTVYHKLHNTIKPYQNVANYIPLQNTITWLNILLQTLYANTMG